MIPSAYMAYAKLIGLGLIVVSLMGLGGLIAYNWQARNVAQAEKERDLVAIERDRAVQRATGYQSAIDAQKAASAATVAAAEAQQAKADKAIAAAKAERDRYEKKLAQIAASIEKDKLDPSCKAQLEQTVCGVPFE